MNFKYVFGFLLLIPLVSQACAWKWQNALALTEALQNFIKNEGRHPFLGIDVTGMNKEEKMNICTDAATRKDLAMPPQDDMVPSNASNLEVGVTINYYYFKKRTFSVFSCGENDKKTYFFGQGPRANTIAVYMLTKDVDIGAAVGIMDYPYTWKWYNLEVFESVMKDFVLNEGNYHFLGKDVTEMDKNEKNKICADATNSVMSAKTVVHLNDVSGLEVELLVSDKKLKFSVFSCGEDEKVRYFFGKGPSENTIAVYEFLKAHTASFLLGIMDYSWQPQQ